MPKQRLKAIGFRRLLTLIIIFLLVLASIITILNTMRVSAIPWGYEEFFVPLWLDDARPIFDDIDNDPSIMSENWYARIGVTSAQDDTTIYWDHWENGLETGTTSDEQYTMEKGEVMVFEGNNMPVPRVSTSTYYDPGDRIYVSGVLLQCVVVIWPANVGSQTGTVFTDAWELYPLKLLNQRDMLDGPGGGAHAMADLAALDFQAVIRTETGATVDRKTVQKRLGRCGRHLHHVRS